MLGYLITFALLYHHAAQFKHPIPDQQVFRHASEPVSPKIMNDLCIQAFFLSRSERATRGLAPNLVKLLWSIVNLKGHLNLPLFYDLPRHAFS